MTHHQPNKSREHPGFCLSFNALHTKIKFPYEQGFTTNYRRDDERTTDMKNDLTAQVESAIATARQNMTGDRLTQQDTDKLWKMYSGITHKIEELEQAKFTIGNVLKCGFTHYS